MYILKQERISRVVTLHKIKVTNHESLQVKKKYRFFKYKKKRNISGQMFLLFHQSWNKNVIKYFGCFKTELVFPYSKSHIQKILPHTRLAPQKLIEKGNLRFIRHYIVELIIECVSCDICFDTYPSPFCTDIKHLPEKKLRGRSVHLYNRLRRSAQYEIFNTF